MALVVIVLVSITTWVIVIVLVHITMWQILKHFIHNTKKLLTYSFCLQKSDKPPQEVTASDTGDMANGSHPEADEETSAEAEQVDEATEAKRQLLVKAAPLAGIWALERFGLADVTVLKLLEPLPGGLMTVCEKESALGLGPLGLGIIARGLMASP